MDCPSDSRSWGRSGERASSFAWRAPTKRRARSGRRSRPLSSAWEVVIGMEVHVQPKTRTKMFCGCAVAPLNAPPNTYVCEICLGLPGTLPVANRAAVEACLKTALALNCEIPRHTKFDRKNYMYPDLPKRYQISQYDLPMSVSAYVEVVTRKWRRRRSSEAEQRTFSQRSKEFAEDYRYFPEPDLPPLEVERTWIDELHRNLPELPSVRRARLLDHLPAAQVAVIGADRELADLYENAVAKGAPALPTANWIVNEVAPTGKLSPPANLAELMKLLHDRAIKRDSAREVYVESVETGRTPAEIVAEHGYAQVSDESELRVLAEAVIDANPKAAADYRDGKKQAIQALMADFRKRAPHANPKVANELLLKLLA